MSQANTLSLLCWNVKSIVNKVDEVTQILSDENIDIALIQETWLSSENNVTTAKIKTAGFDVRHIFREKRGAGVAVLFRNSLNPSTSKCSISNSNYVSFQHQCMVFNFNPKVHIINIYRHQEISIEIFVVELENLLNAHSKYSHSTLLAGDFNVHYDKIDSPEVLKLDRVTTSFGLSQNVVGPTHNLGHTLDLVFANSFELDVQVNPVLNYVLSDHYPVTFKINNIFKPNNTSNHKRVTFRNIKGINIEDFKSDLSEKFTVSFEENLDFETQYNLFSQLTCNVLDNFAPQKTKTVVSNVSVPWHDAEFKTERALRRKLEREWKKSKNKDGIERSRYVDQRKKCASLSSMKRSQYLTRLIKDCQENQGSLFKIVSQVLDKNKHSGIIPQYERNFKTLANDFNNFYVDKVSQIRNEIPSVDSSECVQSVPFNGTVLEMFAPTTVDELRTIIKQGEIKTAFNDVLPKALMKSSIEVLLPYICSLINTSLATGSIEGIK